MNCRWGKNCACRKKKVDALSKPGSEIADQILSRVGRHILPHSTLQPSHVPVIQILFPGRYVSLHAVNIEPQATHTSWFWRGSVQILRSASCLADVVDAPLRKSRELRRILATIPRSITISRAFWCLSCSRSMSIAWWCKQTWA